MRYVMEGEAAEIIIRENRIRAQRGVITFTPLADEVIEEADETDNKEVDTNDTKDVKDVDTKTTKKTAKK